MYRLMIADDQSIECRALEHKIQTEFENIEVLPSASKAGSNSTPQTNSKPFPEPSIFFRRKVSIRWKNWMQPCPLSMTRQAKSAAA